MKRVLIGFLALFVFAMAAQAVDVYPTGNYPDDVDEVSAAVNGGIGPSGTDYGSGGGTVVLKPTLDDGITPMFFNFGNTGEDGYVDITKDVIIRGEDAVGFIDLPALLPDQAHAPQIIDEYGRKANRTTIYGGSKAADNPNDFQYAVFRSYIGEEADVNNPTNYPNIDIEHMRFDSFSGSAIFIASSKDHARVDDCVFSNPRHTFAPFGFPFIYAILFTNFPRATMYDEENPFGAFVYLNGEISVTNCEFYMDDLIYSGMEQAIRVEDLDLVDKVIVNNNTIHSRFENHQDPAASIELVSVIKDNSKCYIGTDEYLNEAPNIIYSPSGISIGVHAMFPPWPEPGEPPWNIQKYVWYNKIYNSTESGILLNYYGHPEDNLSPNVVYKNEIIDHNGLDVYSEADDVYPSAIWLNGSSGCGVVDNVITGTGSSAIALVGEMWCGAGNTFTLNNTENFVARDAQVVIACEDSNNNTFSNNTFGPLSKSPKGNVARILVNGHDNTFELNKYVGPVYPWEEGHGVWLMKLNTSGNKVYTSELLDGGVPSYMPERKAGRTMEDYFKDMSNPPANELWIDGVQVLP